MRELTFERASEVLIYKPESGDFKWLRNTTVRQTVGLPAGSISNTTGYLGIQIDGRRYQAHRVAWLLMTGAWPIGVVDHIDGNRANNAWANLRDVSRTVNAQNRRTATAKNTTGLLGVSRDKGRFRASIKIGGKLKWLGTFDTAEAAQAKYIEVKRQVHEGCAL